MRTIHIFDIDTTIANNDHRVPLLKKYCIVCGSVMKAVFVARRKEEHLCPSCGCTDGKVTQESWDDFLDPNVILNDAAEPKAIEYVTKLRQHGAEIHFITGRHEKLRSATETWLSTHFAWNPASEYVIMRPNEVVGTRASVYKEKAFLDLRNTLKAPDAMFFFYEDDPFVFNTYAKYGVVFQCPEAFDFIMPVPKPAMLEASMNR